MRDTIKSIEDNLNINLLNKATNEELVQLEEVLHHWFQLTSKRLIDRRVSTPHNDPMWPCHVDVERYLMESAMNEDEIFTSRFKRYQQELLSVMEEADEFDDEDHRKAAQKALLSVVGRRRSCGMGIKLFRNNVILLKDYFID